MHEEPKKTGNAGRFFEEKGFYIILFLCVAAIGIAGYVLFLDPTMTTDDAAILADDAATVQPDNTPDGEVLRPGRDLETSGSTEVPLTQDTADVSALPRHDVTDAVETADNEEPPIDGDAVIRDAVETIASQRPKEEPKPETPPVEEAKPDTAPTFFVRPVSGEVVREFSGDELVYDRTMGDWRTHNGTDFAAADGTLVSVVADGTVTDVYHDTYYGTAVLVTHGGGLTSMYYGLIENATVEVGQAVKAGDTIGAVSTNVLFEALEPAHVHVEMKLNGARVDPMAYLPA